MTLPGPLSRSDRRKARTVASILDAAERHVLERGWEAAKVDEIAADADVAVGSIYNHFGSKDGLYLALAERAIDLHAAFMEADRDTDLPPLEQLLDVAGRLARFGREHPAHLRLLFAARQGEPSEIAERVGRHLADQERRTAALIEAAVRKGDARPVGSRHAAAFLWSAWLAMLTGPGGDERTRRGVIEAGLRIVVGGIASDRARRDSPAVRAILQSAPASPASEPAGPSLARLPVTREVRSDFPDLAVWTAVVEARPRATTAAVTRRLEALGDGGRASAAEATGIATESVPWAYRVYARRAGIDLDADRPAAEAIALRRLGGPPAAGRLPADALALAALETGVPVAALDADRVEGRLYVRLAAEDEPGAGGPLIADEAGPVAVPLGPAAPGRGTTKGTRRLLLAALQVKGVPDVGVQEALWTAIEVLGPEVPG